MGLQFLASAKLTIYRERSKYSLDFFCIAFTLDLILSQFTSVSLMENTETGWKMQYSYVDAIIAPNAAKYTNFSELS